MGGPFFESTELLRSSLQKFSPQHTVWRPAVQSLRENTKGRRSAGSRCCRAIPPTTPTERVNAPSPGAADVVRKIASQCYTDRPTATGKILGPSANEKYSQVLCRNGETSWPNLAERASLRAPVRKNGLLLQKGRSSFLPMDSGWSVHLSLGLCCRAHYPGRP